MLRPPRSPRTRRRTYRPYAISRKQHPARWLLARVWDLIGRLWSTVIVGGLFVSILVSYLTDGTPGVTSPDTWFAVRLLRSQPVAATSGLSLAVLLTITGYIAHRLERAALIGNATIEYVLKRVDQLDPRDVGLERYVDEVYLPRRDAETDADAGDIARKALRAAVDSATDSASDAMVGAEIARGICVFGRPMAGKRRLAWEAMQDVLPGWTLVKWPYKPERPFDYIAHAGRPTVLWLDGLSKYISWGEAATLNDLPRRFAEAGIPLVVIATCRLGVDKDEAEKYLGDLLRTLAPISLTDISREQGDALVEALDKVGVAADMEEFDQTPGSVLLGVANMRDEIYPRLKEPAKQLLHTLKLLRSAGIYTYPASLTRETAKDVFRLARWRWERARNDLIFAGFVRLGSANTDGERNLEPVADVYLERAIKSFPPPRAAITDYWIKLQQSLTSQRDAKELISLGFAFLHLHVGAATKRPDDLLPNKRHAEECFRTALELYDRARFPFDWARAQRGLGSSLIDQAELAPGDASLRLLEAAVVALRAALEVVTRERDPAAWADAQSRLQSRLGYALFRHAERTAGDVRAQLLLAAEKALRSALEVCTRERDETGWANVQHNLGNVFLRQAVMTEGDQFLRLLQEAEASYRSALEVCTRERDETGWANVQHNLGAVQLEQANLVDGAQAKVGRLRAAEVAFRAAQEVRVSGRDPVDRASTQHALGQALKRQAGLASGMERLRLSYAAEEIYLDVLENSTRELFPREWASTHRNLADLYLMRSSDTHGRERVDLLGTAERRYRIAQEVFTREHFPYEWADVQFSLAVVNARLAGSPGRPEGTCADLGAAQRYLEQALTVYTSETFPANHERAVAVRDAVEKAKRERGCTE